MQYKMEYFYEFDEEFERALDDDFRLTPEEFAARCIEQSTANKNREVIELSSESDGVQYQA